MKVVAGFPPNYNEIVKALGRPPDGALFAWGEKIFTARPSQLDKPVLEHEATHALQQARMGGPKPWWDRYLVDRTFRLEQEIAAYRAQYRLARELQGDRYARRLLLPRLARDLSSPMYGSMIRVDRAARAIAA